MSFRNVLSQAQTAFIRWLRRHLTGEALLDGIKTCIWVIPLTILIWVYAEQDKPRSEQNQTIRIDLRSSSPDRVVSFTDVRGDMITVDISGSKAAVDRVMELFNREGQDPIVTIQVPATLEDGTQPLSIVDQVMNADFFKANGVQVKTVRPTVINVDIDTIATVPFEVKAPPDAPVRDEPTFIPSTVQVTGPARQIRDISRVIQPHFPKTGEDAAPGTHSNVTLPLQLPFPGARLSETTVKATYTIKESDADGIVSSMPVLRLFSPGLENDVLVDAPLTIGGIRIRGPKDAVERIVQKKTAPYAILRVQRTLDYGKPITTTLEFDMIEPHVMVHEEDRARPFTYTLRQRTSAP